MVRGWPARQSSGGEVPTMLNLIAAIVFLAALAAWLRGHP
jgi:hypothetical protein